MRTPNTIFRGRGERVGAVSDAAAAARYTRGMPIPARQPRQHSEDRSPRASGIGRIGRAVVATGLVLMPAWGCASDSKGPDFLPVAQDRYDLVFDAACEVARSEGLVPEITDRRAGSIETQARTAGSVIEPWAWKDLTASEVVEGTFGFERRRARFEFVPAGFKPVPPEGTSPLAGPVLPGSERGTGADVARSRNDLELRVSVSIERQFRPGYQGPAYTRSLGTFATDVTVKDDPRAPRDRSLWTPVARDERLERLLLERIAARLEAGGTASPVSAASEAAPR